MDAAKLERAIACRDAIRQVDTFIRGVGGDHPWQGQTELCFGSYKASVSGTRNRLLIDVLVEESEALRAELKQYGVDPDSVI